MNIFLTGATGFLGSHTAEVLLLNGHKLLLAKRAKSDTRRCGGFADQIAWVDTDTEGWADVAISFAPEVIINCAWDGVGVDGRAEWARQVRNIEYQQHLLNVALACGCKKVVGLGSQAEYGQFNGVVSEDDAVNPTSAYGATKLAAQIVLKTFCEQNDIKWYWFRLFSAFGEREDSSWLIPSVIRNMMTKQSMDMTGCEQKYSYLYVKDVSKVIAQSCVVDAPSGVYNVSSTQARPLKDLLEAIRQIVNPSFRLNFGALAHRVGQSMHNQGDMTKTSTHILSVQEDFDNNLLRTISYYKTKNEGI